MKNSVIRNFRMTELIKGIEMEQENPKTLLEELLIKDGLISLQIAILSVVFDVFPIEKLYELYPDAPPEFGVEFQRMHSQIQKIFYELTQKVN